MRWVLASGFTMAIAILGLSGCEKVDEVETASNQLCRSDKPCPGTLACGKGASDRAQCIQRCFKVGPGPEAGCSENTFCYVPPETAEAGFCTLVCATDKDCQARHPSLKCKVRTQTEEWGLQICVLE